MLFRDRRPSRLQGVRYGQGWVHLQWRAVPGVEDDGDGIDGERLTIFDQSWY